MEVWKMIFLFNWVICRFHANFQGCKPQVYLLVSGASQSGLDVRKHAFVAFVIYATRKPDSSSLETPSQLIHKKKTSHFPLYWLLNRDPYNDSLWTPTYLDSISSLRYPQQPGSFFFIAQFPKSQGNWVTYLSTVAVPPSHSDQLTTNQFLDPPIPNAVKFLHVGHWKSKSPREHFRHQIISSWWFQPLWKILVKMGIFPK